MTEPHFRAEQLHLSGVSHGYGDRELFTGVELVIAAGEHAAVVGENGAGKSTLTADPGGYRGACGRHGPAAWPGGLSGADLRTLRQADSGGRH